MRLPGDTGWGTLPILPQTNASASAMNFDRPITTYRDKYGSNQVGGQAAYKYGLDLADDLQDLLVAVS